MARRKSMDKKDITDLMRAKGWSQAELARQLDLSEGAVSRWMSGENQPMGPARILMRQWLDEAKMPAAAAS